MVKILIFVSLVISSFFLESAKYKITANNMVIKAIELIERILIETISINSKPIIGNGIDPITINLR